MNWRFKFQIHIYGAYDIGKNMIGA